MNSNPPSIQAMPANVDLMAPLHWLRKGWLDFLRNPLPGLFHGLLLAVFGWALVGMAYDKFWLLAGAFSGFLLVAPILTTGLYEVSRQYTVGRSLDLKDVLKLWAGRDIRLVKFGALLSLAGTGWVLTSASLITLMSPVHIGGPADFLNHVVLARDSYLFELWLALGGLLAAPVYASSVVAIPMLVDTKVSVLEAVQTSWRVVATNPITMGIWGMIIMGLVGFGLFTALVGLVFVIPMIAHASWHAYCELTASS